jgi:hypothetical protein
MKLTDNVNKNITKIYEHRLLTAVHNYMDLPIYQGISY